jgi:hypothetical protein
MLAKHASELRKRGIVTSTVGVGHNYSPTQLQAIAEAGGGRMHDAEEPGDIAQIVMAELNDTLSTVVDHLELLGLLQGAGGHLEGRKAAHRDRAIKRPLHIGGGDRRAVTARCVLHGHHRRRRVEIYGFRQ